ncbi:hypothetical protein GCM10009844_09900 [Nocardioides koreensis]|uniref:Uncharacterized protein n=1 Tax=Nocardioides koreensis TaxID=433651 RepID=A0ABN2ZD03_9ACTN
MPDKIRPTAQVSPPGDLKTGGVPDSRPGGDGGPLTAPPPGGPAAETPGPMALPQNPRQRNPSGRARVPVCRLRVPDVQRPLI